MERKIYWPGFSVSSNHASDKPHWVLCCHCTKFWSGFGILIFFCAKHFFHHLLIYFHVKHPISALHINHASFEALKLVFWFPVGKDKIHVGCCWNKMYIWDSGILLWFLSFSFFAFFVATIRFGILYLCCLLSLKGIEVYKQNVFTPC